jgi:glutathione S-transferase
MITIHHLGVSQSERIVWLCEELEVPYALIRYERDPETRLAPPEYRRLHPMGIAPVIEDGPLVLAESGAIIDYIISRYGQGRLRVAPDQAGFSDYLFWYHFANGTLMPSMMSDVIATLTGLTTDNPLTGALRARGQRAFGMIEQRLGEAAYFAGDAFTAADIMMLFPLATMRAFAPRDYGAFPNLRAYLQRIADTTVYRRAMAKADPGRPVLLD